MLQAFCNEQTGPDIFREMGKVGLQATTLSPESEASWDHLCEGACP